MFGIYKNYQEHKNQPDCISDDGWCIGMYSSQNPVLHYGYQDVVEDDEDEKTFDEF